MPQESSSVSFEPESFKDPEGRVFYHNNDVYRSLSDQAFRRMSRLFEQGYMEQLVNDGLLIDTELVSAREHGIMDENISPYVLKHKRVPVISYSFL